MVKTHAPPSGQKYLEIHIWAGCREQGRRAQLDGGAGRAAGPVSGMAGPAAGSTARRVAQVGQGRWGLVRWVDWAGQTGTQVVHPQLLPLAILENSVGDQPGLPTSSLAAGQN